MPNIELTRRILSLLGKPESLIRPVTDRPGHDRRYSLDCAKLARAGLGAAGAVRGGPGRRPSTGTASTRRWWRPLKEADPAFREHYQRHYGGR